VATAQGFILLYRSIEENWVWKDPQYLRAWMWMLLRANFEENESLISGNLLTVKRGELITSLNSICLATGLTIKRARTFLKNLEKAAMIRQDKGSRWTKITICNYDSYQGTGRAGGKRPGVNGASRGQAEGNTINKVNNDNKERILNTSFEIWWNTYDKKRGDKNKLQKKWATLIDEEKAACMTHTPLYVKSTPDKQFRSNPEKYLNQRGWEWEIIQPAKNCAIVKEPLRVDGSVWE